MRFAATQNMAAFIMALAGLGAAALGSGASTAAWMAMVAGLGALFIPGQWMASRVWQMVWSASTLAGLAVTLLAVASMGSLLLPIHVFVIYLVVVKLYNRRRADDYFHLYLTSLMALVGAAATNFGPSFIACLVVHLVASFWTLSLYQLRKDLETAQLVRHKTPGRSRPLALDRVLASKRVITTRFLMGAAAAAMGAMAFAGLFFLLFPRIGAAGFKPNTRSQGFARKVSLGGIGLVRDDPRLVMRVRLDPRPPAPVVSAIHWRAATLDRYMAGRWSRSRLPTAETSTDRSLWSCSPDRSALDQLKKQGRLLHQRILVLPETDGLLPSAFPNLSVRVIRPSGTWNLGLTADGSGTIQSPWPGRPVVYEALSVLGCQGPSPAAPLSALPCNEPPVLTRRLRHAYLALPRSIGPQLLELSQRIAGPDMPPEERIRSALAYLSQRNGFSYTRHLPNVPTGRDPVLYFLLEGKKGHCEYFASALTLLLRAMGLPARLAVGFLGGRWNPYGRFLAVRRGDAHAWTEVWIAKRGWLLLDATPPEGRRPKIRAGLWARVGLYFDAIRIAYLRWVVDYDTMTQFHAIKTLRRALPWRRIGWTLGLGALFLVLVVAGRRTIETILSRKKDRSPDTGRGMGAAIRPLRRLLAAAEPWIGQKPPGRTLRAHLATIPEAAAQARPLALEAIDAYYELRFGHPSQQKNAVLDTMTRTARQATAILEATRRAKTAHRR